MEKRSYPCGKMKMEPLDMSHAGDIALIWQDKAVTRFTNVPYPCTQEEALRRVSILQQHDCFAVRLNDEVIAVIGCIALPDAKNSFGIFYHFKKSAWGKGLATEAARWFIGVVKGKCPDAEFIADVVSANAASVKILERLGFKRVSLEKDVFLREDERYDVLNYKLK